MAARRAHNPKVSGSNPLPTKKKQAHFIIKGKPSHLFFFKLFILDRRATIGIIS